MKIFMQKIAFFLSTTLLICSGFASAAIVQIGAKNKDAYELKVSQVRSDAIILEFALNQFETTSRLIDTKEFADIRINGLSLTDTKGLPAIPKLSKDIVIPFPSTAKLKVLSHTSRRIASLPPTPSRGEISRCFNYDEPGYLWNKTYYESQTTYPENMASLSEPFIFRDTKGVNLQLWPMAYDFKTSEIRVTEYMKIEIKFSGAYSYDHLVKNSVKSKAFFDLYRSHFLNFDAAAIDSPQDKSFDDVEEKGEFLIISHDKFIGKMAPFVEWKRKLGFRTHLNNLRDIGESYEDVKKYIKNFYTENPALGFVLLVGDSEFVPYHEGKSGNASGNEADPMYGLIEGNDSYPEVIIGRFPAKSLEDIENMIYRSINYEKSPAPGDWFRKAIGIASNEGSPSDGERANDLRTILMESKYTAIDKLYDPGVRARDITSALNEGRGLVNYIGHGNETSWGTGDFDNSDIRSLKNSGKLPVIVDVACLNGRFGAKSDSFAEVWLKAGTAEEPTGAIAIFASSTEQDWVPPTVGQKAIAKFISQDKYHTVGALFTNGSIAVLEDGANTAKQTFETWHIFGDPTLKIKTQ